MKPKLKDAVLKVTAKAVLVGIIPFLADDLEGDILRRRTNGSLDIVSRGAARAHLVRRTGVKFQNGKVTIVFTHRLETAQSTDERTSERERTRVYDGAFVLSIRSG
jgi:hypothetical protein